MTQKIPFTTLIFVKKAIWLNCQPSLSCSHLLHIPQNSAKNCFQEFWYKAWDYLLLDTLKLSIIWPKWQIYLRPWMELVFCKQDRSKNISKQLWEYLRLRISVRSVIYSTILLKVWSFYFSASSWFLQCCGFAYGAEIYKVCKRDWGQQGSSSVLFQFECLYEIPGWPESTKNISESWCNDNFHIGDFVLFELLYKKKGHFWYNIFNLVLYWFILKWKMRVKVPYRRYQDRQNRSLKRKERARQIKDIKIFKISSRLSSISKANNQ